jgi:hypothetical protein
VLHGAAVSAQGPNVTEREIRMLLDQSATSWNRGDLDGHLADNADSISFMTRNDPIVGKAKTTDALRRSFFRDGKPILEAASRRVAGLPRSLELTRHIGAT